MCLGSNDSRINPHMPAKCGCSQTAVSKRGGGYGHTDTQTHRHTDTHTHTHTHTRTHAHTHTRTHAHTHTRTHAHTHTHKGTLQLYIVDARISTTPIAGTHLNGGEPEWSNSKNICLHHIMTEPIEPECSNQQCLAWHIT